MSYGTPDQLQRLLRSIRVTVDEEPDIMWDDADVRVVSRELADLLYQRLNTPPPIAKPGG